MNFFWQSHYAVSLGPIGLFLLLFTLLLGSSFQKHLQNKYQNKYHGVSCQCVLDGFSLDIQVSDPFGVDFCAW